MLASSLLLLISPVAYALTFQPVQELGIGLSPSIAVDGLNVYVAWRDIRVVLLTRSGDGGQSFSTPISVTNDINSSSFPVVAASGSYVYVAWLNINCCPISGYPDIYFSRSTDGGISFGASINISNNPGDSQNAIVAAEGSNVYVVWQDDTPGNYDVFIRRSTDFGASFEPAINLSNSPANSGWISLSLTGSSIYVAWSEAFTTPYGVKYVRRSTDGGATFGGTYSISTPAQTVPRVLFASDNNVYAVWLQQVPRVKNNPENYDVFFARSIDGGVTFSQPINISSNPSDSWRPRISVSGSTVYVAWVDGGLTVSKGQLDRTSDLFLRQSTDAGTTFGAAVKVTDAADYTFRQDSVWYGQQYLAAAGGNVYLVWYQQIPNTYTYEVYLRRGS